MKGSELQLSGVVYRALALQNWVNSALGFEPNAMSVVSSVTTVRLANYSKKHSASCLSMGNILVGITIKK